jgi:hypothetical protein
MNLRPSTFNVVLERLKDNAAEDTIQMARDVQTLVDSPGWQFLIDFLEARMAAVEVEMEKKVHEHAQYAAFVAERRALRDAPTIASAVIEAGRRAEKNLQELNSRLESGEHA